MTRRHRSLLSSGNAFDRSLALVLALGLMHGLLYVAIVPPWQHYDEPTHLEYVRLIVELGRLPHPGDVDLSLRQEIAASMQAAGFWKGKNAPAIDFGSQRAPDIGQSELTHPALYYLWLALPQTLVRHQDVETQLYLARVCSVLLFPVVLLATAGLAAELFPRKRRLPLVAATFVALLPPFVDLMSSVNNDVGAAAVTSLFLWACARWARRGFAWRRVAAAAFLALACLAVKTTAGIVALVVLATVALSFLPARHRRWYWAAGGALVLAGLTAMLGQTRNAAHWYSDDPPSGSNRSAGQSHSGGWSLVLSQDGSGRPRTVFQELPRSTGLALRGRTVTVGAWLKAAEGSGGFVTLALDDGNTIHWQPLQATPEWAFHSFTATLGIDARGVALRATIPEREGAARTVYLDDLVVLDSRQAAPPSTAADADASVPIIQTPDQSQSLLLNGSAERGWPGLPAWLGERTISRESPSWVFQSLLDLKRTAWAYPKAAVILFKSFWGGFGWNHLALPAPCFTPLLIATLLGAAGTLLRLARAQRRTGARDAGARRAALVVVSAVLTGWAAALLRVHPVLGTMRIYWPVARYASVVIAPTALLLCLGWGELAPQRWRVAAAGAGLLALVSLDAIALFGVVVPYYYGG